MNGKGIPLPKIDLKKTLKHLYKPSKKAFSVIEVPRMHFLMIDGAGDPNTSSDYKAAVGALYGLAYTVKFINKRELDQDYVVMPLEGLWWAEDMAAFNLEDKQNWLWTMMLLQPDHITAEVVEQAREKAAKKKDASPLLSEVRFAAYDEGLSVQILYIGAYADEAPTIAQMHAYIEEEGFVPAGKHHEIYLSDPNRTAPEKLKTIIRQPVARP